MKQVVIGHSDDPRTQLGPLAMKRQLERVEMYIEEGRRTADLVTGGRRPPHLPNRSITPDLRWMQPGTHAAFHLIVLEGALVPLGMPRWDDRLSPSDVDAIHAYLIDLLAKTRAEELARQKAGVPLDAPSLAILELLRLLDRRRPHEPIRGNDDSRHYALRRQNSRHLRRE